MTVASVAVIALVIATTTTIVQRAGETVFQFSTSVRTDAALYSAEQTTLYHLLTRPMGAEGLQNQATSSLISTIQPPGATRDPVQTVIRTDFSPYRSEVQYLNEPVVVRILDNQSKVNFSSIDYGFFSEVAEQYFPDTDAFSLYAATRDFEDPDDLERLGGAESEAYPQEHLPPNRPLREILELCQIQPFQTTSLCNDRAKLLLSGRVGAGRTMVPELVPAYILQEMLEVETDEIESIRTDISNGLIRRFGDIGLPALDTESDPFDLVGYPGPELTLITHLPSGEAARLTLLELTPGDLNQPFTIVYKYAIGGAFSRGVLTLDDLDAIPALPEPSALGDSGERIGAARRQ